jgi:protein-L-isoaspartate(D-aspartate) O-methyltransferase
MMNQKETRTYKDELRHKGLRKQLIESIRKKGITDERVLAAMENIPRHFFMDPALDSIAYEDRAFPIDAEQTISQPFTVAYQTQLLKVRSGEKILEVGTGSVYQASVLAEMGASVFTIERQRRLYDNTRHFVLRERYPESTLRFFFGDGFEGLPYYAPFDKIIITCGAPFVPPKLVDQLRPGGIMVVPVAEDEHHRMLRVVKQEDESYTEEEFSEFSFVPMLGGTNES